jgi:hypothetical protein
LSGILEVEIDTQADGTDVGVFCAAAVAQFHVPQFEFAECKQIDALYEDARIVDVDAFHPAVGAQNIPTSVPSAWVSISTSKIPDKL